MPLKLYNTFGRKKQVFKPLKKGQVGIYSCGPTVYLYQHIGNLRSYIFPDILKRVLMYKGYKVKHVMNVTDVGHLTSDADKGEDKIEQAAKREGKKAEEIADYYLKIFKKDLEKVNVIEPDIWPKATEHIKEQIDLIKKLEKKGFTYKTNDGIYFDSSKDKNYGKLAKLKKEGLKAGKRIAIGEKKHKTDFALWKFSEKLGVRQQEWKSPWGVGFPGWHIECSAMSSKYLGQPFDIHTGGEDHVPIHHTNEIAQSENAAGKKLANYWLHGAFLKFFGGKMSKSKGEITRLSDLEEQGHDSLDFRYFMLTTHYRKQLNFSRENLGGAKRSRNRLKNIIKELKDDKKINEKYLKAFELAMDDDLDTVTALQILWAMLRDEKAKGKIRTIKEMDKVFGLDLLKVEKVEIPNEVLQLFEKRNKARADRSWGKADDIRKKINKLGFRIDDTKEGSKVSKI